MLSPFLLLLTLASIPGDQPPPPPKREPDPEPDPWPRVMHPAQMEVLRDERERAVEGTATFYLRPSRYPVQSSPWQPWIPPRRVADPEKKRARKAQKKARRAGR